MANPDRAHRDQKNLDDALDRLKSKATGPADQDERELSSPATSKAPTPACLIQQIRKGYFPRLSIPPRQEVIFLTDVYWVWVHWFEQQKRNLPCHRKDCPHCETMAAKELGYALAIAAQQRIQLLTMTKDEYRAIEDLTLPGLLVRLDRRQRTSQLQMEIAEQQRATFQLPQFSQTRMDDFLCRLFGQISVALLNKAKGWAPAKEGAKDQPEILPFDAEKRQQG